jgi:elongation factor P
MVFNDEIIGIHLPIKVDLKVTEAAPAVKGNTVQGGSKLVTLETGATVNVPMFVNEGDILRINTETGEYTERVTKA